MNKCRLLATILVVCLAGSLAFNFQYDKMYNEEISYHELKDFNRYHVKMLGQHLLLTNKTIRDIYRSLIHNETLVRYFDSTIGLIHIGTPEIDVWGTYYQLDWYSIRYGEVNRYSLRMYFMDSTDTAKKLPEYLGFEYESFPNKISIELGNDIMIDSKITELIDEHRVFPNPIRTLSNYQIRYSLEW